MTRLFIDDEQVELSEDISFAITSQFEDLDNPTNIINNWSKSVNIPRTNRNIKIFGDLYNPDRTILLNEAAEGIYFNPYKKYDFRLFEDDNILMEGYIKINSTTEDYYNITLFGQLGKILQDLKQISFVADGNYKIETSTVTINTALIRNRSLLEQSNDTQIVSQDNLRFSEAIQFIPNNAKIEGIDYESVEYVDDNNVRQFISKEDYLKKLGIINYTFPQGILPFSYAMKSYSLQPVISMRYLFQLLKEKAADLGYKLILDSSWFNKGNPFYANVDMLLQCLNVKNSGNDVLTNEYGSTLIPTNFSFTQANYLNSQDRNFYFIMRYPEKYPLVDIVNETVSYENGYFYIYDFPDLIISSYEENNGIYELHDIIPERNEWKVVITWDDYNGNSYPKVLYSREILTGQSNEVPIIKTDTGKYLIQLRDILLNSYPNNSHIQITVQYNKPLDGPPLRDNFLINIDLTDNINVTRVLQKRDNFKASLQDFWDNKVSFLDVFLNYCKIFRIGIIVKGNDITFKPIALLMQDYTITDMTDKVDKTKEFSVKSIVFPSSYLLMNYDENKSILGQEYKEQYGVEYGEYKLKTYYEFDTQEKKLFKSVINSISVNEYYPVCDNPVKFQKYYNTISMSDKDTKYVSPFGGFIFNLGYQNNTPLKVQDDTDFQKINNQYTVEINPNSTVINVFPKVSNLLDKNMLLFNKPMKVYTEDDYSTATSIYSNFWQNYLNERYSRQNKLITCYLDISPTQYYNWTKDGFLYSNFIKIDNQLYCINKIYDYNFSQRQLTKVDLITIQNINAYITNNFSVMYRYIPHPDNQPVNYLFLNKEWNMRSSQRIYLYFSNGVINRNPEEIESEGNIAIILYDDDQAEDPDITTDNSIYNLTLLVTGASGSWGTYKMVDKLGIEHTFKVSI